MPRARDPNRDKAFEIWKSVNGEISNRALAEQLGVPEKTISAWKSRDKWNVVLQTNECSTTNAKSITKKTSLQRKAIKKETVVESKELTDKQWLFSMYYVKYFNATKAYQKAYGCSYSTAMVEGHRTLRNPKIKSEIDRLKSELTEGTLLRKEDVLQKYIDIAFADITDFAEFGKKEVQAMGPFGPIVDEDGNPVMVEFNYVDFKDSAEVDGTIITEVKKGKDGVSVKLADKMKALDMLAKYFDLLSDNDKKKLQEEKLKVETERIRMETNSINKGKTDSTLKIEIDYGDDDK